MRAMPVKLPAARIPVLPRGIGARADDFDDTDMPPFSAYFTSADRKRELLADPHVLALIQFGDSCGEEDVDPRCITVELAQLGPSPLLEVWRSETPVESGVRGQISYSRNDDVLLGHIAVDEREFADLEEATRVSYEAFPPFAGDMGFPHYLRIWNYIPDINGEENGMERYKSFCIGRHAAFEKFTMPEHRLPAASGVGSPSGRILVYFLAARSAGAQVENPRQVSAFHYPEQYGPKSPAFSRAMVKDWGTGKHLYISGTASIVGHESRHRDHVLPQLEESLHNMSTLVHSAEAQHGIAIHTLAELSQIKVYVRDEQHQATVRDHIHEQLGEELPVIYLSGDLCRKNLLVEVEGLYAG
jgi:chorismate lyase/3-hydroxybenzoate synthase